MADHEQRIKHESFGFIRASRVQGHAALFDSAVRHQHYIGVEIGEAEQLRRFSETYVHGGRRGLISISMSESQFAQFITSMNTGSGAPCTLNYVNGQKRAEPPPDINTRETFENEVKAQAAVVGESLNTALRELRTLADSGKAGKKDLVALIGRFETVQRELVSNMPFMMKQFAEGIEKVTDRAKMDLNAHAVMLGQRLLVERGENSEQPVELIEMESKNVDN